MPTTTATTAPGTSSTTTDHIDQELDRLIVLISDKPPGGQSFPSPAHSSTEIMLFDLTTGENTTVSGSHGRLTRPLSPCADELLTRLTG